jgi:2-keto-4-pentenoate hydratase/2-oxohepta-3-ene-1,7-dioic acid hydratase in catechol pathway
MKQFLIAIAFTWIAAPGLFAQTQQPFKLGTFETQGQRFLGVVIRDNLVGRIDQADAALPGTRAASPADMKALISSYDTLRARLYQIANAAVAEPRPAWVQPVSAVKILPPVMPGSMLNAAVNYVEHGAEMAGRSVNSPAAPQAADVPAPIPGIWERAAGDTRQNPYLFPKLPATIIANGEAIRIPPKREQVDWECELTVVVGRPASRVATGQARDYIFGYTLHNDVSDRGGRADRRHGSDWFIGKSHDTFGPLGPFIVPKEFVADPQKLKVTLTVNSNVMQDSNTDRMTHNVYEMTSYASHVVTLQPGDTIAMGSPAGVGAGRETPLFLKGGDTAICSIESIGVLTNPVVGPSASSSAR